MRVGRISLITCSFISLLLAGELAAAQQSMQQPAQQPAQLERLLNSVDTPSTWSQTPVSGNLPTQGQPAPYPQNSTGSQAQYFNQPDNGLFIRQQLLRMFLGGTPEFPSSNKSKSNWGSSSASSDLQEAENQASRAYDALGRAKYDKEKSYRQGDADDAYYAANAAREASDRVYRASLNGDPTAKEYADRARAAADRARGDADKARYYADTGD